MTAYCPVEVERWLYKDRADPTAHALAALDLRLGIIEGFWTTRAAEQASWVVTQMTPQKAEELFARVGNMALQKALGERWEAERETYEAVLREAIVVPEGTATLAVSIDGVLAPIDGGNSPTEVRRAAAADGRLSRGPAGYRETGCATLAFCDDKGDLLSAIRFGRGPEPKKLTLKESLRRDIAHVLAQHPDLRLAKITDAGSDNWAYLATRDAAGGAGGPRLLSRQRAPRRSHGRRDDGDAAQVRGAARAPDDGGRRCRRGDQRPDIPAAKAPAHQARGPGAPLLPKE